MMGDILIHVHLNVDRLIIYRSVGDDDKIGKPSAGIGVTEVHSARGKILFVAPWTTE